MDFLKDLLGEKVNPKDVAPAVTYHDQLNPSLWDKNNIKPDIREKMEQIAHAFIKSLKLPELKVTDIILTGSAANFNWTKQSDIDLHIVADLTNIRKVNPDLLDDYLFAKKANWNNTHSIKIYGFDVELYVQDEKESHASSGVYSILKDKWITKPKYQKPTIDDSSVKIKAAALMDLIDSHIENDCSDIDDVEKTKEKIKKFRQSGLSSGGEFSIENLVFKTLRNNGYLRKLSDCYIAAIDKALSLE
jgi:predicted nucleotidyltransferase